MKVLMVTELFPPDCGGGGWSTYNLAKALDSTEEVDVKVLAINQEGVKDDELDVEKVSVTRFPNELAYYQIYREVEERKDDYDIIQGQHSLSIPPLGLIDDKPTVGVVRDYWPVCYQTTLRDNLGNNHLHCGWKCLASTLQDFHVFFPYKLFNHHLRQYLAKKVDLMAPRSRFVEERLQDHGFNSTEVMYNFVPEGFASGIEPEGEGDIIYVGKLTEQKGPQLLVEAIPDILEEYPDQEFVFLGDGPLREELEERVEDLGVEDSVEFKGHVSMEEVKSRMKGARVVVSPSLWYEPLSRVIIEAQALGTPVLTTSRGGNGEAVDSSLAFDPDTESFSGKLRKVLKEDSGLKRRTEGDIILEWLDGYEKLLED